MAELFCEDSEELRKQAKTAILLAQMEQKKQHDKKTKPAQCYLVGDIVAIRKTQFETAAKLKTKFLGPYKIV